MDDQEYWREPSARNLAMILGVVAALCGEPIPDEVGSESSADEQGEEADPPESGFHGYTRV